MSSITILAMQKKTLPDILAANLAFFMSQEGCPYPNANALGRAAKVSPNSVRNLLNPKKRTVTTDKPEGYPTLDTVEKIAIQLNKQVWELFHPDIEKSIRERAMYAKIEADFAAKGTDAPARPKKIPLAVK